MKKERASDQQLMAELLDAARNGNWDAIEQSLLPQLEKVDQREITKEMLSYTHDEDDNIRDLTATVLAALTIEDPLLLRLSVMEMSEMAIEDQFVFPAGRAAAFLLGHRDNQQFGAEIENTLLGFRKRVQENNWAKELNENVPPLVEFLR